MTVTFEQRLEKLDQLSAAHWLRVGIEKESLRVLDDGTLSQTPHPTELGSALTNSRITTDFSENLVELVTPPVSSPQQALTYLNMLHRFVYDKLARNEMLWTNSMPCLIANETNIPIAHYGTSNVGLMKRVYRKGLAVRYGKVMQTIAGIHFNISYDNALLATICENGHNASNNQTTIDRVYFGLIRNFHRHCWLLLYLFGASPAVCKSFLQGRAHNLDEFDSHTLFAPFGTSLRMSDLGYQNSAQGAIKVDYNTVEDYTRTLIEATQTSVAQYESIGIFDESGAYQQLNSNLLQIENEYYAVIRPKRVTRSAERPSAALLERGVEYVEMRCIDLDPFEPTGISEDTANFLAIFGLYCLLEDSPVIEVEEQQVCQDNQRRVVNRGRDPDLTLRQGNQSIPFADCATRIIEKTERIANSVDASLGGDRYKQAVAEQRHKIEDVSRTPSARVIETLRKTEDNFFQFAMQRSNDIASSYNQQPTSRESSGLWDEITALAAQSHEDQKKIEDADNISFETYLARYFG